MNALLVKLAALASIAVIYLRREACWLTLLLLSFAAVWAFVIIAALVVEGDVETFDGRILRFFRNAEDLGDPIGPAWLEMTANDITALGGYPILILFTVMAVGYLMLVRRVGASVLVVAAVGGGMLISQGLKALFERPRPDLVPHLVDVHTLSFPSGHSTLSAVTYLTLGALIAVVETNVRVKAYVIGWAVILTIVIGLSRVYLGVHWPTDVLAGWCVGTAWALFCQAVAGLFLRRREMTGGTGARPPA